MTMGKRIAVVLTALGVLGSVGAVAASPAFAAWDGSAPGYVCLWDGNSGTGAHRCYAGVSGHCTNINDVPNTHNSFWNRRGDDTPGTQADDKHVQFYSGRNCTGALLRGDYGDDGPFASGDNENFWRFEHQGTDIDDRNKDDSIFFNTG